MTLASVDADDPPLRSVPMRESGGMLPTALGGAADVMRILIVEDELITARDLAETLRECGHEVVGTASSHDDAINLADETQPDLVFIDISIKGDKDGVTLARNLREESDARIIFLTALSDRGVLDRVRAIKPDGFVVKPFTFESILSAVELSGAASEPAAPAFTPTNRKPARGLPSPLRDKIAGHIDRNFNRDLPIAELAELAELSPDYFAMRFRESFGKTPHQYITEKRLDEAKHLLRHTRYSIGKIAEMVGYSSQAHFTTLFRKTFAVTPSEYQNG